ncbi:transcription initiation factor TFIID subunit 5 [Pyrus ussuriensis x Pyrus communis]|uniref:Transcription initiation factor TFIID subunit 5 n=1 Tax=Pyrus ussuriensis x Pyrus communis TaxID=2448454 RepID=A0A5N5GY19_9ROSA|nr:transcription initiation factor TFIID subunit 5 [Pyrus ussuriensis x Pyrus communis]
MSFCCSFYTSPVSPQCLGLSMSILTSKVYWFDVWLKLLEDSLEERLDKAEALDSEKAEGESKEGDRNENKKKLSEGAKQGASNKKLKKDKAAGAAKSARPEATPVTAVPRVKPELTLPVISAALPSVSFYTFINTHNGINCSSISHDGSMVAGRFSDSSLKVWDVAKIGQQSLDSALQVENGTTTSSEQVLSNGGKNHILCFRVIQGQFIQLLSIPLGIFILSSSADSTVRLWSTKLNANLVCYKGHNYPVWDVQDMVYGQNQPLRLMAGHLSDVDCVQWHVNCNYIATGSSDKTVRLRDVQTGECVRIFIGYRNGAIMMWDLSSGRCVTLLTGHTSCVWTLDFSGDGSLLASGSADCTVKLWDVTANTLKTLPTKSTPVHSLRFSRRNLLFASGVLSKTV